MEIEYWQHVSRIFNAALKVSAEQRADFVDRECSGDEALRAEVRALISAHESFDSFIDSPATPAERDAERLKPGDTVASFRVLSFIGAGGMGEVYLAEDERLDRRVALKLLPIELINDQERRRRFELEARAASRLNHPGIITVYEVGFVDERPFIAMEFVEGETLRERIADGPMSLDESFRIAAELASALRAAHREGILHRDIKPENIMLRRRDGAVRVLDFGLAKPMTINGGQSGATAAGTVMGTAAYMSPEQALGKKVDERSDIWSFGVVIFEAAVGRNPFQGSTPSHTLVNVLDSSPDFSGLPQQLRHLVMRCLRKAPSERYASFEEITDELDALAETNGGRLHVQRRSYRGPLAAAAISVAVLFAVLGAYYYIFRPSHVGFDRINLSRLTTSGKENLAAISPDGKRVVHVTEEGGQQGLYLTIVGETSRTELLQPSTRSFLGVEFGLTGDFVYYTARDSENARGTLHSFDIAARESKKILDDVDSKIALSPDGRRFAYIREEPTKSSTLLISSFDGIEPTQVVSVRLMPDILLGLPDWSPDGETIACPSVSLSGSAGYSVIAFDLKSKTEKRISGGEWASINQIEWIGPKTFLMSGRQSDADPVQIWKINLAASATSRVTNDLNDYWTFSVATDKTAISAVRTEELSDIWQADLTATTALGEADLRRLTSAGELRSGIIGIAQYDPNGILYTEATANGGTLMLIDGGGPRRLVANEGVIVTPSATSDGARIIFAQKDRDGLALWSREKDADASFRIPFDSDSGFHFFPDLSPDGKWYTYCATNRSGKLTLRRRNFGSGGDPVVLADHNAGISRISPDGRWIAFNFQRSTEDIWRIGYIPANGGTIRELPVTGNPSTPFDWSGDSKHLYVIKTMDGISNLEKYPIDGQKPTLVTAFRSGIIFNLDVSPDGKRLALSRGSRRSDIVIIKDNKEP